jgi:hypothetical protein
MAHGNTFLFLFHDVSNFRTPFLNLLVSKCHFQVPVYVPVSAVTAAFRDFVGPSKEVLLP